jgi:hypothetical protein
MNTASHTYGNVGADNTALRFDAGKSVETKWVEYAAR